MTKKSAPQLIHDLKPPIDSIHELVTVLYELCHSIPEHHHSELTFGMTKLVDMIDTLAVYMQQQSDAYAPELLDIKNRGKLDLSNDATIVILDNDTTLTEALRFIAKRHNKKIITYNSCDALLSNLVHYAPDTVFFLDYVLDDVHNGAEVAKKLHAVGYSHLYIMSGYHITHNDIPPYAKLLTDKKELLNFINRKTS